MPDTAFSPRAVAVAPTRRARDDALLFTRYQTTRDLNVRDELVERFLPLAKRLARRYGEGSEYDDLVQVASFALMKAIDRFDPGRGIAFTTYAVPTIVGEIKRYFRDHSWTVRVPRDVHDRALHVRRESERLTATLGRSPTAAEIAEALDVTLELVLEALQAVTAHSPDRLDAPVDIDDDEHGANGAACEESGYEIAEASATLAPLIGLLTSREQRILKLRFEHDLTQSEIGTVLGVSQMYVSRTLRHSIARLQAAAATQAGRRASASISASGAPPAG